MSEFFSSIENKSRESELSFIVNACIKKADHLIIGDSWIDQMGLVSSVECSVCTSASYGRCDHCKCRFCSSHFRVHHCTGINNHGPTTLYCIPECRSCGSTATGSCGGCGKRVCYFCFSNHHRIKCGRKYSC